MSLPIRSCMSLLVICQPKLFEAETGAFLLGGDSLVFVQLSSPRIFGNRVLCVGGQSHFNCAVVYLRRAFQ